LHGEIRESLREHDVEGILERAKELCPKAPLRGLSENGPRFSVKHIRESIRISGMSHVRISWHCPQSNGKIGYWHKTLTITRLPFLR
jgi:transposase InsO family protein